jgi:hypothetical protein
MVNNHFQKLMLADDTRGWRARGRAGKGARHPLEIRRFFQIMCSFEMGILCIPYYKGMHFCLQALSNTCGACGAPTCPRGAWGALRPQSGAWGELRPQSCAWGALRPQSGAWNALRPQSGAWVDCAHGTVICTHSVVRGAHCAHNAVREPHLSDTAVGRPIRHPFYYEMRSIR